MKLSILIPTLFDRGHKFKKIYAELCLQSIGKPVEVLYEVDNREITTGQKRNNLLEKATGDYVVFVDDDDLVIENYVESLLKAINTFPNPDVVTFNVTYNNGKIKKDVYYSIKYKKDQNLEDKFLRIPNHLMCVKRHLALKAKFPNKTFGEDAEYSKRLLPFLRVEYNINQNLYEYRDFK